MESVWISLDLQWSIDSIRPTIGQSFFSPPTLKIHGPPIHGSNLLSNALNGGPLCLWSMVLVCIRYSCRQAPPPKYNIAQADPIPVGAARHGQQNVTRNPALRLPPDTAKVRVFGDHEVCSYTGSVLTGSSRSFGVPAVHFYPPICQLSSNGNDIGGVEWNASPATRLTPRHSTGWDFPRWVC